jgi:hypothetical protein
VPCRAVQATEWTRDGGPRVPACPPRRLAAGRCRPRTASPPGQVRSTRRDGAIRPAFSDNSVVGHTRINPGRGRGGSAGSGPGPCPGIHTTPARDGGEPRLAAEAREGEWHSPMYSFIAGRCESGRAIEKHENPYGSLV